MGTFIQVLSPGVPVNSFYVFEHIREDGRPIYRDVNGDRVDGLPNGAIDDQDLYVDQNDDGIINQDDLRPFHDPAPKWILGHSSYLAYGNWDLGFTLRSYLGNYVYNNVASNLGAYAEVDQRLAVQPARLGAGDQLRHAAVSVGLLRGGCVVPADG